MRVDDLEITSPDFSPDEPLASHFSALGGNQAPRLAVAGIPDGTVELAVICHDADAPLPNGFTHWLVYGIATQGRRELAIEPAQAREALNETNERSYFGPQPPPGHGPHRYYFWVYALDLPVEGEPTREQFLAEYGPHIIEQNRLVGTYER